MFPGFPIYCLSITIFQKLHFSKSHFSGKPQEKYHHVVILHSKSFKKCHKNFENRFTHKIIMPKMLRVWHSANIQYNFVLVWYILNEKITNLVFFPGKIVTSLADILTIGKALFKIIFWHNFFDLFTNFQNFCGTF